jgi:tetratricopeptide (TPR) repeat protein
MKHDFCVRIQTSAFALSLASALAFGFSLAAGANQVAQYSSTGLLEGAGPGTAKITFAPDGFRIEESGKEVAYDFNKKRVYAISRADKTYTATDLNAMVYFRVMELGNRLKLQKVLDGVKATTKSPMLSPIESETVFGMVLPGEKAVSISERTTGDTTTYTHDDKALVTFVPSKNEIDASCKKSYARFIADVCPIHPEIRKKIVANAHLPADLEFLYINERGTSKVSKDNTPAYKTGKLVLQSVESEPDTSVSDMALNGLTLVRTKSDLTPIWNSLDSHGDNPQFPTREEAIKFSENAAKNGQPLDALLALLEYGLETGEQLVPEIKALAPSLQKDENASHFLTYLSPDNEKEAKEALKSLSEIDRSKLKKGAVVDIMQGNIESQLDQKSDSLKLLIRALTNNPFIVGAYHDLGEGLTGEYQMDLAWQCFDEARKLRPDHPMLKSIDDMEAKLQQDFPDYF